jgi:hypothetical protein
MGEVMMANNREIQFRPHRYEISGTLIFGLAGVFSCIYAAGSFALYKTEDVLRYGKNAITSTIFAIVCFLLAKWMYDYWKVIVCIREDELLITQDKLVRVGWNELTHACYGHDYKGHPYWILSSEALERDILRKIRFCGKTRQYQRNGSTVIFLWLGVTQCRPEVEAIIRSKVPNIYQE